MYDSVHNLCTMSAHKSAKVCIKSAWFILCILAYDNRKVLELHTFVLFCIMSAESMHKSAFSMHQVCIFTNYELFPEQLVVGKQT